MSCVNNITRDRRGGRERETGQQRKKERGEKKDETGKKGMRESESSEIVYKATVKP